MNSKLLLVAGASLVALSGCAATSSVRTAPAVTSYAANQDQIDGQWGVLLDLSEIPTTYESGEFTCSGWTYTVDSASSFERSVLATLDSAFEDVRLVNSLPSPDAAQASGFRGFITVEVSSYDAFLSWLQGFWTARARAEATIRIGVDVRAADGTRITGFSDGAQRSAEADSGGCGAGERTRR